MTLKIGNVELRKQCDPRPDGGHVTDALSGSLCRRQGRRTALIMEMVSAKAILYKNKNTQEL